MQIWPYEYKLCLEKDVTMNDEQKAPAGHIADVDPDAISDSLDAKEVSEPEKSVGEPATEKRHWLRRLFLA